VQFYHWGRYEKRQTIQHPISVQKYARRNKYDSGRTGRNQYRKSRAKEKSNEKRSNYFIENFVERMGECEMKILGTIIVILFVLSCLTEPFGGIGQ